MPGNSLLVQRAPSPECRQVTFSGCGRAARTLSLTLLLLVLGTGVPVQGHSHHVGDEAHLGAPGHGHGTALVQNDMRAERTHPPRFVAVETTRIFVDVPQPRRVAYQPQDEPAWESRAPPTALPRAPPL